MKCIKFLPQNIIQFIIEFITFCKKKCYKLIWRLRKKENKKSKWLEFIIYGQTGWDSC